MRAAVSLLLLAACGGDPAGDPGDPNPDELVTYGPRYEGGQFHLGPVDWAESEWHNACAPGGGYDPRVQAVEGAYLAGLWGGLPDVADACDACIYVTDRGGQVGAVAGGDLRRHQRPTASTSARRPTGSSTAASSRGR
jgi:hypothetical protein